MSGLVGLVPLISAGVRRDRVRILVWVLAIAVLVALTAASVKGLFPTQADLDEAALASEDNAAALAFNGPAQALDTIGGQVAFQVGAFGLVVTALMSLLMVGRLTRGEEEAGRLELIRALPVGRHAPTTAAVVTVSAMALGVGVLVTVALLANGLSAVGSITFGVSYLLLGLVFAGVALVAAQVTENTRVVYGISGAVLGASFLVRAIGDVGNGAISWLSPIGWAQKARPFAGERWLPLLVMGAAAALLAMVALRLEARRDVGAGLVAPRPGPPRAAPSLGTPIGLAARLQRGSLVGWGLGVLATGIAYGSIGDSIEDFVGDSEAFADMLARAGGASLTDSYLATSFRVVALLAACFGVQAVLRLRAEETGQRAEPLLATPLSRARWGMSHMAMALVGSLALLVVAGLSVGLSYGLVAGDLGAVPELVGAALAYLPAAWVMVGLTLALVGWAPRAAAVSWVFVVYGFIVGLLGELLGLPGWLEALSPFENVPLLPAADLDVVPLAILSMLAAALAGLGIAGLRQRDLAP